MSPSGGPMFGRLSFLRPPLPAAVVPSKHKRRLGEDNQNSRSENANPRLTTTAAIKTLSIAYSAMVIARSSSRTPVAAELLPQLRLLGWRLGVRGDGVLLSQTQHDTITPGGQSPMCWRSPKIQTHVLAITKNTNPLSHRTTTPFVYLCLYKSRR